METLRQTILKEKDIQNYKVSSEYKDVLDVLTMAYTTLVECRGKKVDMNQQQKETISIVSRWLCGEGKVGLLLYGTYGTGKTTMLNSILYTMRYYNRRYLMTSAKSIVEVPDENYVWEYPLIIDELGREPNTRKSFGNESEPMIDIIVRREKMGYPTIIATNLTDEEIKVKYGLYIADRFRGSYSRIFYGNKSYR